MQLAVNNRNINTLILHEYSYDAFGNAVGNAVVDEMAPTPDMSKRDAAINKRASDRVNGVKYDKEGNFVTDSMTEDLKNAASQNGDEAAQKVMAKLPKAVMKEVDGSLGGIDVDAANARIASTDAQISADLAYAKQKQFGYDELIAESNQLRGKNTSVTLSSNDGIYGVPELLNPNASAGQSSYYQLDTALMSAGTPGPWASGYIMPSDSDVNLSSSSSSFLDELSGGVGVVNLTSSVLKTNAADDILRAVGQVPANLMDFSPSLSSAPVATSNMGAGFGGLAKFTGYAGVGVTALQGISQVFDDLDASGSVNTSTITYFGGKTALEAGLLVGAAIVSLPMSLTVGAVYFAAQHNYGEYIHNVLKEKLDGGN